MLDQDKKSMIHVVSTLHHNNTPTDDSISQPEEHISATNQPFQRKTSPMYGLLIIPIIVIITIVNIDFVIPKGIEIPFVKLELRVIVNILVLNGIQIAAHHFSFLLIMGKEDVNSGINLIYQYLIHGFIYNLVFFGLPILQDSEVVPFKVPAFTIGAIGTNIAILPVQVFIWIRLPKSKTSDTQFRKRFIWFMLFRITSIIFILLYNRSAQFFDKFQSWYQAALVFVLLGIRYVFTICWSKIVDKACGDNGFSARFVVSCGVGCIHALFLMLMVGSKKGIYATFVYAFVDVTLIIRLFFKISNTVEGQNQENSNRTWTPLELLALRETLEILLPLCFSVIKILAFIGPNKETLPFVQNLTKEGLYDTFTKIFLFMLFDATRILIFAIILFKRYKISMFQTYCELMKNYWNAIACFATLNIFIVSIKFMLDIL